ncbi:hypothetical protein AB4305_31780 [Nocardia sp. 2YAB30]|uniref:hypothetical protein n=1 Tax=Nocardia sp. 2YAB30 TaxID=3233022 RepID=UPI003F9778E8
MRTRDARLAEQRRAHRDAVMAAFGAALPELPAVDIPGILAKARADKRIALRNLAGHLSDHPDALSSGSPRCPVVIVRLAHVLHAAGYRDVVRPGCAGCGKVTHDLPRSGPDGRLCQSASENSRTGRRVMPGLWRDSRYD